MGCHFLLQETFQTQGLNTGLSYCRQMLYHLSHQGSPSGKEAVCQYQRHKRLWWGRSPGGEHGNSCILAWRISWTEEPVRLQSMESQRLKQFSTGATESLSRRVTNLGEIDCFTCSWQLLSICYFMILKKSNFIYFWLCWVFVAVQASL